VLKLISGMTTPDRIRLMSAAYVRCIDVVHVVVGRLCCMIYVLIYDMP
jgi:hypothetical protein